MNKRHHFMALTGIWLLTAASVGQAESPTNYAGLVRVPSMPAPAMSERWINSAEWQAAGQVSGWSDRDLGADDNDRSQVAVGHDAGVLYVRFACPIAEKFRLNKIWYADNALKSTAREKDGDIFKDDYVGIYLTPPGGGDVYFLGVNGTGITRDSRNGEVSWNGQWQTQQSRDDFFWTVGFAIPLNQLGGAMTEDQAWGVNFAHGARQIELLESIWAYRPTALQPMAEMRLSTRAIAVALAGFGGLSDGSLALKGQVGNLSGEPFDGALEVAVQDFSGVTNKAVFGPEKTPLALKPGEKKGVSPPILTLARLCAARFRSR